MNKVILIRFNEIHLKGGNKKYFTKLLYNNIKYALKDFESKINPKMPAKTLICKKLH